MWTLRKKLRNHIVDIVSHAFSYLVTSSNLCNLAKIQRSCFSRQDFNYFRRNAISLESEITSTCLGGPNQVRSKMGCKFGKFNVLPSHFRPRATPAWPRARGSINVCLRG